MDALRESNINKSNYAITTATLNASAVKHSIKRIDAAFTRIEQRQQSIIDMLNQVKHVKKPTKNAGDNEKIACGKGMNAANILHYR